MRAILVSAIVVAWTTTFVIGQADEPPAKTPFQESAASFVRSSAHLGIEFGHVPRIEFWKTFDTKKRPAASEFVKDLLRELETPDSPDHGEALDFLQVYVGVVRAIAQQNGIADLDGAARRSLEPNADAIEVRLRKAMASKDRQIRWKAGIIYFALRKADDKAAAFAVRELDDDPSKEARNAKLRDAAVQFVRGDMIPALIDSLSDSDREIREQATMGIIAFGPKAKTAVPALIELFEKGKLARGKITLGIALAFPCPVNLALAGLTAIKSEARAAAPAIVRRYSEAADDAEKREMIVCLAAIEPGHRDAVKIFEDALRSKSTELQLAGACALLQANPDHKVATDFIAESLATDNDRYGPSVFQACIDMPPASKRVVAALDRLLDSAQERTRIEAMRTLAAIGRPSVPSLKKVEAILTKPMDGGGNTALSHAAAARALAAMGDDGLSALIRVTRTETGGVESAAYAIGTFHDRASPEAIQRLIQLLDHADPVARYRAAVAIIGLADHARTIPSLRDRVPSMERLDRVMGAAAKLFIPGAKEIE